MRARLKRTMALAACLVTASGVLWAQGVSEREVRQKLEEAAEGKADQARRDVARMLERAPDDPGVRYLEAALTKDGALAAKRFEAVARQFPESPWADDALFRLYQYDYAMGLYRKADEVMTMLRARYPRSPYLTDSSSAGSTPAPRRDQKRTQ